MKGLWTTKQSCLTWLRKVGQSTSPPRETQSAKDTVESTCKVEVNPAPRVQCGSLAPQHKGRWAPVPA